MSTHGELIQALKVLKNVKEKRHGIKALSSLCANRFYQVKIVRDGGWKDAILPLIISLDEDCRKYASLAIANLSTVSETHQGLLNEDVIRHLVPILQSEEVQEVVIYVLNALGNFATSSIMWPSMQQLGAAKAAASFIDQVEREELLINALFCLGNMTGDPVQRAWMMQTSLYKVVWKHMTENRNIQVMQNALALLRGLAVESEAQDILPRLGIVPHLIGIFTSPAASRVLKTTVLDLLLHLSFRNSNAEMMLQPTVMSVIMQAATGETSMDYVPVGVAIIANLCESVEHHDAIVSSPLFEVVQSLVSNDNTRIQMHVVRAMMHLSLSPKYHHVILATGVTTNVCPIAMTTKLTVEMRANALQMFGAVCATHPTAPTSDDIMNLLFLVCNPKENIEIRRASMMALANASSDQANTANLLNKAYIESLVVALSKCADAVLTDYLMMFFHNVCKLDTRAGSTLLRCGWVQHLFTYERLESLSGTSAIYLCDTCRQLAEDAVVRAELMQEMVLKSMLDAWLVHMEDPQLAPHLALMSSALAYHGDTHEEFVLQGGVRLVIELYSQSAVEHVRLCCLLTLLYLSETPVARRAVAQERGMSLLLTAAENETHIDLVTNAMKALIPFASSDDYRPDLGMEGGMDTFASFLFSDQLALQQLGGFLLQNLLELGANRRIFLGLSAEKQCEEDYLEPLSKFLPKVAKGAPSRIVRMKKDKKRGDKEDSNLSPHDPFMLRTSIHCIALLSLEHSEGAKERFLSLQLPHKLYDLFYSEQIDKSSGEAVLIFFANCLHAPPDMQGQFMKGLELVPTLLCAKDMDFSAHTNTRCLSALLSLSRVPDFRRMVVSQLDLIMASVNSNLASKERDEDFYSTTAVHCALLCELARASTEFHEKMAKAGVVEAFLVFMTVAGRGVNDEMCIELLMSAVFGISALVSSPKTGEQCMASLLFPATRLQLIMSLLRLPSTDINMTYHSGTIGLRALQRNIDPAITPEDLQLGGLDFENFLEQCAVKPSAFVYRNIIRTLGLLLAHPEMAVRMQEAISPQRIVPTCTFALRDAEDMYVNVYGYLLVATFSKHELLRPGFVNDASVVNELLSGCRRGSSASSEEPDEPSVAFQLDSIGKGAAMWSGKSVALSKYLLSMVSLTNFAESIREVYKIEAEVGNTAAEDKSGLTLSNRIFMKKLSAICLKDLDADKILSSPKLTDTQQFSALLKVVVLHNTFVSQIELEALKKGGEVKVEKIGVSPHFQPAKPQGLDLIPKELRTVFKTLKQLQNKCEGLLDIIDQCLDTGRGNELIMGILECLAGLCYLSPLSILDPHSVYRLFKKAPEWLHSKLACLFCNALADEERIEKTPEQESGELLEAESDFLFPLISASTLVTRHHMLGALANLGPRPRFLDFIDGAGVFRVIKPLPNRTYFIEHFGLIIESARLLTNMTCHVETHDQLVTESVVGFLRDVLRYSAKQVLYDLNAEAVGPEVHYEFVTATFEEDDVPPLGLRIRWNVPPFISEVLPDTPAARSEAPLMEGDELVEVNGTDVTEMEQSQIEPFFETRPLTLVFRRTPDVKPQEEAFTLQGADETQLPQINKLDTYGDPERYLECFNLVLLTLHNLCVNHKNHLKLMAEPKILDTMLDIIVSQVLSPTLRRIAFSLLTCLAVQKDIAGRIFQDMADYFRSCEKGDPSLQKYIMLCANLFYTSMKPEEVVPDTSMLMFVGRLAAIETANSSNEALIEVLHGMSRAPIERRKNFICRETVVVLVEFLEKREQWEVQLRAFEAAYFLTLGACDPVLWSSLDLVSRMAKAATKVREFAGRDEALQQRADGLFELTMRCADICLKYEILTKQLSMPELDRYLMDLFAAEDKPASLTQTAANLMIGLIKSEVGGHCWQRWKRMGLGDRLNAWFRHHRNAIVSGGYEEDEDNSFGPVTVGHALDTIIHFMIFAVEMDGDLILSLISDDIVSCVAYRILSIARWYKDRLGKAHDGEPVPDMTQRNTSFRSIAQLLTALATNEHGLSAMGKLGLGIPLMQLLELPSEDFRLPALIILSSLCATKDTCHALMTNLDFIKLMKTLQQRLKGDAGLVPPQELEYFVCILDRSCCYPDLCKIVQEKLIDLLFMLPHNAETMNAQVMSLRALARCAFSNPSCLERLPEDGQGCLHYIMAATNVLRNASPEDPDSPFSIRRRAMITRLTDCFAQHPEDAKLVAHFSRAILCEAVSVSKNVCVGTFPDLSLTDLLDSMVFSFDQAYGQIDAEAGEDPDTIAASVLNNAVGALHILLNVVFRQSKPGSGDAPNAKAIPTHYVTKSVTKVLEALSRNLRLSEVSNPKEENQAPAVLARKLLADIRVLWYVTALLREICAAPVHSPMVEVVRSEAFFNVLEGSIQVAVTRLRLMQEGKPQKNLFATQQVGGVRESPIAGHLEDFDLGHIFEHLVVCMRHVMVQAMFVPPVVDEAQSLPWVWASQHKLTLHSEAFTWIPDILRRFNDKLAIKMEVVRYICAAANYYNAPHTPKPKEPRPGTAPQDPAAAAEPNDDAAAAEPVATALAPHLALGTFCLLEPHILHFLTEMLETCDDPCLLSLACLAASNLAGFEQQRRLTQRPSERMPLPIEDLQRLVVAVVRVLKLVPRLPRSVGEQTLVYAYRIVCNLLAFEDIKLMCATMDTGFIDAVRMTFDYFFRDVLKISSSETYTFILRNLLLFLRNWITSGCKVEIDLLQLKSMSNFKVASKEELNDYSQIMDRSLDVPSLLNLLTKMTFKLTDGERELPDVDDDAKDNFYNDVLTTVRTLLKRSDAKNKMLWRQVDQSDYERLLEEIKEHRFRRMGVFEDEEIINILYLMTKQAFQYQRSYFPDFLMQVAYGDQREKHTLMQDIAAVCCAIISTQNAKEASSDSPTINIAGVVSNHAKFVNQLRQVPDPRMQLWHYRLLIQWSMRPQVLEEISADADSLTFVVEKLLDPLLSRYSVILLHNISVLRHGPVLSTPGHLSTVCAAYRRLPPGPAGQGTKTEEMQRRLLRRLLVAILRNCVFAATDLNTSLGQADLECLLQLCDAVEAADTPLYLAVLLHLCRSLSPDRLKVLLPGHAPLTELLVKRFVEQASRNEATALNDSEFYDLLSPEEEERHMNLDAIDEAGTPLSPSAAMASTMRRSASPSGFPGSPKKGLGKKLSLYQQQRMKKQKGDLSDEGGPGNFQKKQSAEKRGHEQEFIFFATSEVLTHTTFRQVPKKSAYDAVPMSPNAKAKAAAEQEKPIDDGDDPVRAALQGAFGAHPISKFLAALRQQVTLHEKKRLTLTDFFMQVAAKFIWHCWASPLFRQYFDSVSNLEVLADLAPFFLNWPHEDVKHLMSEAVLFAGLHRYSPVTNYLVDNYRKFPELACACLTKAFVDPEAVIPAKQAAEFIQTFTELLRSRLLSRTGVHRLAVGLAVGLVQDHPEGICAYLIQREHSLLGDVLEQMHAYHESGTVKQCMVATLAKTAGSFYKALPELDEFVLRVLELAAPLLDSEFVLFFPVLHRLAHQGGKRVKTPMLSSQLHMRVARLLEQSVTDLERSYRNREAWERQEEELQGSSGPQMSARQKVQWMLAYFASLATAGVNEEDSAGGAHDQHHHFDAFVCVDLLPTLVRILKKDPHSMETCGVMFLLASVCRSPCIVPHMPDILRLSEDVLPAVIDPLGRESDRAKNAALKIQTRGLGPGASEWEHLAIADESRADLALRRSFIHLVTNAGFMPKSNPALLVAPQVFAFVSRLQCDEKLFSHPTVPLHAKVYCLAQLCAWGEQQKAIDLQLLDILKIAEKQIGDSVEEHGKASCDMRLPWISCAVSLAVHSGAQLIPQDGVGVDLFILALKLVQEVLRDNGRLSNAPTRSGLHMSLECQQAMSFALAKLSMRMDFGRLRTEYALFLLSLVCSAPLLGIRTVACEHLTNVIGQGYEPEKIGAVFLKTPCLLSFRQIIQGPLDDLAISCTKIMQALAQCGGHHIHVHLLPNLEGIIAALGDPNSNAARVLQLAQLFVDLTKARKAEVLDAVIELQNITPFLGLARSSQASRREIVLRWLEAFGSSLYEIDEVNEVFSASTLRGLLHLATRSTLEPEAAQDLRRILFALVQKRVDTWRANLFGVKEFLSEILITSVLAMCERQPDLQGAAAALLHSLLANKEAECLERVWTGGHFAWLCQRLVAKSRAQLSTVGASTGQEPSKAAMLKAWEKHADLTCAQGMILRVLWKLYDMYPNDLPVKAVKTECVMKAWTDFLTYYAHHAWPLRESSEVERGTDATLILAMQLLARVSADVNADLQVQLIQQGAMGLCMTVLLPNPQAQQQMRDAICPEPGAESEDTDTSEALLLPEAKLVAGRLATCLMQHPEAYMWFKVRRVKHYPIAMFSQLHHWRTAIMEQQGSVTVPATVGLLERCATLYMTLLSPLCVDWGLEHVGLGQLNVLMPQFLEIWSRHANPVMMHHALRMFSSYAQVQCLYTSALAVEAQAQLLSAALHRVFGVWDVRELRHTMRLLIASLAHTLQIPVLPSHVIDGVVRSLRMERECAPLRELLQDGGALRADTLASRHVLLGKFFSQTFAWCDQPGDSYGRAWALWIVLTLFRHEATGPLAEKAMARAKEEDSGGDEMIVTFPEAANLAHLERRAKFKREQQSAAIAAGEKVDPLSAIPAQRPPRLNIAFLRESPTLAITLARIAGSALSFSWKTSQQLACASAARCFYELTPFQQKAVETMDGQIVLRLFNQPDRDVNLTALNLAAVLSSYRLALRAQNVAGGFLKQFYDLAGTMLEGFSSCGQGPYDMAARWLHSAADDNSVSGADFRCLVAFMIGQCACPPLATVPSLDLAHGHGPPMPVSEDGAALPGGGPAAPPVAECDPPPAALLDKLAYEVIREDQRLRSAQVDGKGPLYSAMLCHLLYALAVMVPLHPKVASNSSTVRGAAFSQLMKVQVVIANGVQPQHLFDPADGERAKLLLYVKATACIRGALQSITGSWLAADFGARFAVSEEGGRDFIQYCTRHLQQVYNNKTALTRVLGTPWERMMLSQGPTSTIAELLLMICSADANLKEVSKLGGEQALHALSRYGESAQIKQQATMLLTKLAVMQQIR